MKASLQKVVSSGDKDESVQKQSCWGRLWQRRTRDHKKQPLEVLPLVAGDNTSTIKSVEC